METPEDEAMLTLGERGGGQPGGPVGLKLVLIMLL